MAAALPLPYPPAVTWRCAAETVDRELLARVRAGDREACGILVNRYRDRIVNLAYHLLWHREDAEDVAQEAFTQALRSLHTLREEAHFYTWLYRITVNLCLHRRRRARPHDSLDTVERAGADDVEAEATTNLMVVQALASLSEPLRVVLILHARHGLSYDEIAAVLNIPNGTVASRLSEARRKFKAAWTAMETEANSAL